MTGLDILIKFWEQLPQLGAIVLMYLAWKHNKQINVLEKDVGIIASKITDSTDRVKRLEDYMFMSAMGKKE